MQTPRHMGTEAQNLCPKLKKFDPDLENIFFVVVSNEIYKDLTCKTYMPKELAEQYIKKINSIMSFFLSHQAKSPEIFSKYQRSRITKSLTDFFLGNYAKFDTILDPRVCLTYNTRHILLSDLSSPPQQQGIPLSESSRITTKYIVRVPSDILAYIMCFLKINDIIVALDVSKLFRAAIQHVAYKAHLCEQIQKIIDNSNPIVGRALFV